MPAHTPYDGSSTPFTIGLKTLDPLAWIEVDRHYGDYLAEKDRLIAECPGSVFAAEADTADVQREVLELIVDHLVTHCAGVFPTRREYELAMSRLATFQPHGSSEPRLQMAARFVQEDLVVMRRGEAGWRLAAASLCFPSSWTLAEKFGRPLAEVHAPVPNFGGGTRNATIIERIFDNLKPDQPVERTNWSLQADPTLHKPLSSMQRNDRATARPSRFPGGDAVAAAFIRVERQTLRRLPRTGDILFTIRVFLDPMAKLRDHPRRVRLAGAFAAQLAGLDAAQLDYKGLAADRDRLVAALEALAG